MKKKQPIIKNKEKLAISIDHGLKAEILKISDNVSEFVNRAVLEAIEKCPTCGKSFK